MAHTFELIEDDLDPVLQTLLEDPAARVLNYEMKALKPGVGNPTSLGVYRVSGTALAAGSERPFSLVVKHLARGNEFMDCVSPTHWNYFRREIVFFESAVAKGIPKSIGFPKYLGQTAFDDGTFLFWNEDLGDLTKSKFTWDWCLEAVRLVAELNSIDISDADQYPWLSVGTPTGWLDFREQFFLPFYEKVLEVIASDSKRAGELADYATYLPQQQRFVDLMRNSRQTFVHGDFNLNNLVAVTG